MQINESLESTIVSLARDALVKARHYASNPAYDDNHEEAVSNGLTTIELLKQNMLDAIVRGKTLCELAKYDGQVGSATQQTLIEIERDLNQVVFRPYGHVYCITHGYDIGDQRVFVSRESGSINAKDAALYLQFKAEELFGDSVMLSNFGIAVLLIQFYGFTHCPVTDDCEYIDMYSDRECATNSEIFVPLMANKEFERDGLADIMKYYLTQ